MASECIQKKGILAAQGPNSFFKNPGSIAAVAFEPAK